jgi:hypothetical protein
VDKKGTNDTKELDKLQPIPVPDFGKEKIELGVEFYINLNFGNCF